MSALMSSPARPCLHPSHAAVVPEGIRFDIGRLQTLFPIRRHRLQAGQALYRAGQPFRHLFVVHAGFLKNTLISENGRERVTAFRMRGDVTGMEAMGRDTHICSATALDLSVVWELPYSSLMHACATEPGLQAWLHAAIGEEIRRDRFWMLAQGTLGAEPRVAAFLLHMAMRYESLGFSDRRFVLRMGRSDIASFLSLKHETVTRALSHLAALDLIRIQLRDVQIIDRKGLTDIAQQAELLH